MTTSFLCSSISLPLHRKSSRLRFLLSLFSTHCFIHFHLASFPSRDGSRTRKIITSDLQTSRYILSAHLTFRQLLTFCNTAFWFSSSCWLLTVSFAGFFFSTRWLKCWSALGHHPCHRFCEFLLETEAEYSDLPYRTAVRWLSSGVILLQFFKLQLQFFWTRRIIFSHYDSAWMALGILSQTQCFLVN